jgi:hypothetical protein
LYCPAGDPDVEPHEPAAPAPEAGNGHAVVPTPPPMPTPPSGKGGRSSGVP